MSAADMKRNESYIAKAQAAGGKVVSYSCPSAACRYSIKTLAPTPRRARWDSLTACPQCGQMHFKVVHGSGKVEISIPASLLVNTAAERVPAASERPGGTR